MHIAYCNVDLLWLGTNEAELHLLYILIIFFHTFVHFPITSHKKKEKKRIKCWVVGEHCTSSWSTFQKPREAGPVWAMRTWRWWGPGGDGEDLEMVRTWRRCQWPREDGEDLEMARACWRRRGPADGGVAQLPTAVSPLCARCFAESTAVDCSAEYKTDNPVILNSKVTGCYFNEVCQCQG